MRIAHVTEAWNGGIATYVNALLERQAVNHDVSLVYCPEQARRDFRSAWYAKVGVKTYPYRSSRSPFKIIQIARAVNSILRDINPDIVHLHSAFPGFYGRIFQRPGRAVYCPHGWSFVQESGTLKKGIYAQAERFLAKRCDAIINISRFEEKFARYRKIRAPVNIVVPSGANDFSPSQAAADFDARHVHIGYIGRLDYKKGFDIATRAFRDLPREDIFLHVLGAASRDGYGAEREKSKNIIYHGWVDNAEVDGYIRAFDAVLVPSRHEGFGLTVIEAMRNGKPAIVSDAGALPELVKEGVNGHVFLSGDPGSLSLALEKIDKAALKEMGRKAREIYETRYTADRMAQEIEKLYERVLYASKTAA